LRTSGVAELLWRAMKQLAMVYLSTAGRWFDSLIKEIIIQYKLDYLPISLTTSIASPRAGLGRSLFARGE
jgi:hypothetical protein